MPLILARSAGYKRETFNISLGCLTGISVNMPQTELLIPSAPLQPVLLWSPPLNSVTPVRILIPSLHPTTRPSPSLAISASHW